MKECISLDNIEVWEIDESLHEGMYNTGQEKSTSGRLI